MYSIYCVFIQCLFVLHNIALAVRLYEMFGELDLAELYTSITLVILILEINYKILIYMKNGVPFMFFDIIQREETILQNQNERVLSIYLGQVKYSKIVTFWQCFCNGFGILWFIIMNLYTRYAIGIKEHFMYELWLPFDEEKHDIIVSAIGTCSALYGFLSLCASQAPLQSLMISSATHLRILQLQLRHCFRPNFHSNDEKIRCVKKLIKEHQVLINFITDLNKATKSIILLEFALGTIKGAGALLQILSVKNAIEVPYCLIYLIIVAINLNAVTWSADEVTVQSKNVANAIYESDWVDQNKEIKSMLLIMMMRAQRPLTIDIGPFRPMDMEAALMTMKGAYSYASVMKQMRSK